MAAVTRFAGTLALALLGALPGVLRVGHAAAGEPDGERDDAGALVLFIAHVEDHAAVEGAKVTLTGTSRSGAPVSKVGVTDREGRASLESVPAGLGRFVDESGAAVPGAEVRAFDEVLPRSSRLPIYDAAEAAEEDGIPEPSAAGRAVTDAQGRYRIEDLPAGPIVLRATIEGRRETIASVFLGPDGPAGGPPIRVLWPGSPVSGTVVDGDCQPVGGAEVIVSSARGDSNERRRAVSDAKGRFLVTVADSGGFNVAARRPGTRLRSWQEFDSPPSDVRVPLASATALSLTLLDRGDDRPLSGGSVEVGVRDSMDPFQRDLWTTTTSGTTDDEGRLTLSVPAGFVSSWVVTAAGHQGAGIDNNYWIPSGDLEAVLPIFGRRLRAGKPLALTFRLSARVEGVEGSGPQIRGRVVGPEGRAVAGARVVGVAVGALSARAVSTDVEGRFRLEGAAEQILVRANGLVQRAEDRFGTGAASEGATPELTLRLERPRTVRGRILDAEGHGVAGARVSILPKWSIDASVTTENRGVYEALRDPWATTATDGTYVMNDLVPLISVPKNDRDNEVKDAGRAPGPARIVVRARGFADALSDPFPYETAGVTQAPVLRLSRGARWRGRILDPAGHPVPGAHIRVEADAEATNVVEFAADGAWRSARDGSFLVPALPPGRVKVIAWAEGYASTQKSMHVLREGDLPSLDVVLRPAQRISGRIVDPTGKPVGRVNVLLNWLARKTGVSGASPIPDSDWDEMYTQQQSVRTDGDGRFVLEGVPPGVVELRLHAEGWRTRGTTGPVEIRAEGPPPEIVLEPDPEWAARKREELEARLKSAREQLLPVTDPQVREAAAEEIERLEEEYRGLGASPTR